MPENTAFAVDLRLRRSRKPDIKNERRIEKMQDYGTTLFPFIAYS